MGGFGFDGFGRCDGRHRGFGFGWGGWDGGWDGGCRRHGDKKLSIITVVRAIVAKGDGCFDGNWW